MLKPDDVIPFIRTQNYKFVKFLDQGATGNVALLRDDILEMDVVCKKYMPLDSSKKDEFWGSFIREMKLMYNVYHKNVVRIYNCFPLPTLKTGFIMMEYVNGSRIDRYVEAHPESIDDIFSQVVEGFVSLESSNILHRDIRTSNVLVNADGVVKIIDFGFGKKIDFSTEFDISVNLNWPFAAPEDFAEKRYDYCTEVYFIGKLFEKLLADGSGSSFSHQDVLNRMIESKRPNRYESFSDVWRSLVDGAFSEINFTQEESEDYQAMADFFSGYLAQLRRDSTYITDADVVVSKLENLYRSSALETYIQDASQVFTCFANTSFMYKANHARCQTETLRRFLKLLKGQSPERRNVILSNLWRRFDSVPRYQVPAVDDDIPF